MVSTSFVGGRLMVTFGCAAVYSLTSFWTNWYEPLSAPSFVHIVNATGAAAGLWARAGAAAPRSGAPMTAAAASALASVEIRLMI